MLEEKDSAIFNLDIDEIAKAHMLEMGRWARFLSIVGFVLIGLMLLTGIFGSFGDVMSATGFGTAISGIGGFLLLLLILALWFYPCFMLFKYSGSIKRGLNTMNKQQFNEAFSAMKSFFRYCGIMTIILLSLYLIIIIFIVIGVSR